MKIINVQKEFRTTALAESESKEGAYYKLNYEHGRFTCTCPSHTKAGTECKHIQAFKAELDFLKEQREST